MIKKLLSTNKGLKLLTMNGNYHHLRLLTRHFNINLTQKMEKFHNRAISIAEMQDWENATWAADISRRLRTFPYQ